MCVKLKLFAVLWPVSLELSLSWDWNTLYFLYSLIFRQRWYFVDKISTLYMKIWLQLFWKFGAIGVWPWALTWPHVQATYAWLAALAVIIVIQGWWFYRHRVCFVNSSVKCSVLSKILNHWIPQGLKDIFNFQMLQPQSGESGETFFQVKVLVIQSMSLSKNGSNCCVLLAKSSG